MTSINDKILKNGWSMLSDKDKDRKIHDIWQKKFKCIKNDFKNEDNFRTWYLNQERICACCHVKEDDVRTFFYQKDNSAISRGGRRGRMLEIDKENNSKPYGPHNCKLLCYVCNNAKSNFIDNYDDFKPISEGIKTFWKSNGINIK